MTLIPWKAKDREAPAATPSLGGFRNEMDRLFHSFFGEDFGTFRPWGVPAFGPALDVAETDSDVVVQAEIPGVKADEIDVSIRGDALIISGEKKEAEEKREKGYVYQERRFGSFRREVPLPCAVDAENVAAEYKDGLLRVTLHKTQEALPKRIAVKSG